ncbi:MAG TPA: SUF system Fe-S cluster assembly regulator [Thermoanaerobaculia bacterium]|nr:SUF system Fe-S cluster assembly regulator [Thermoanaerobaculia bacterium]
MIRLNRLTDYAIVVLSQLGKEGGAVRTATQLAQETGMPLPTVAKLLKTLAADHIILSHRGPAGGYVLSRAPEAISVAEIIVSLEGPIALTACVEGAIAHCDVESLCPMRGNWEKVNRAIRKALEELTLADMALTPLFPPPAALAGAGKPALVDAVG